MPISDVFVSVVAPLHDDADVIEAFVREIAAILDATYTNYELVLVDDGSRDTTSALVTGLLKDNKCIRYIRLSHHYGTEVAIVAGLDSIIGDFAVVMQPDSDPPALIPEMVKRARQGRGVVFAVRSSRTGEPGWATLGARLFWKFGRRWLDLRVPESATCFQCLPRSAVNAITRIKDKYRSLRLLAAGLDAEPEAIPYRQLSRRSAPRARGFLESLDLAVGLLVAHSTRPLRFVSVMGLLAGFFNLVYACYVVAIYLTKSDVQAGWTTTSLQFSGMFFLLFLILAALSEYVGRVLEESRDRPLYHAVEERNSNVMVADADRRNVVRESL